MHELMFFRSLMQQITTAIVQIKSVEDLCNKLDPTHNLVTSSLRAHASDIISIVQTAIEPKYPTRQSSQNANTKQNQVSWGRALGDQELQPQESGLEDLPPRELSSRKLPLEELLPEELQSEELQAKEQAEKQARKQTRGQLQESQARGASRRLLQARR